MRAVTLLASVVALAAARQQLPKGMNPNDNVEILSRPAAPVISAMPPLPRDVAGNPVTNLTVYLVRFHPGGRCPPPTALPPRTAMPTTARRSRPSEPRTRVAHGVKRVVLFSFSRPACRSRTATTTRGGSATWTSTTRRRSGTSTTRWSRRSARTAPAGSSLSRLPTLCGQAHSLPLARGGGGRVSAAT